jgi:PAS domain S-box-containing protein
LRVVQLLASIRSNEARLSSIFARSPVGIAEISLQGQFLLVNDAICETQGRAREQLLRLNVADVTHPQDLNMTMAALEHLVATGERRSLEQRYVRPDGTVVFCNSLLSLLEDEHGRPRSALAVVVNLSERKRAEEALRSDEQQLRFALDSARMGTWTWDPVEDVALLDARALEILREHVPGRYSVADTLQQHIHPDDLPAWHHAFNRALDPNGTGHFEVQFRWLNWDGAQVWVQQSAQAHFENRHGLRVATRMTGTLLDITERKAAEERQSLLTREVDHRAKNMLATIQAMVSLSARSHGDLSDFVSAVKHRIASLANAHDLMAVTHWEGARLRTLLDDELEPYVTASGNISIVDVGELMLKPAAVTALTMVIHELVTNAAKYGALSVPEGQVSVILRRTESRGLVLEWKERGGPPVKPPQRAGFGSLLISRSLEIEIGGHAELSFDREGVSCLIELPQVQIATPYRTEPINEETAASNELGGNAQVQRRKVLLVEDQATIALEMSATIESLGYEVVGPAATLDEATQFAQNGEFDAAILDIRLGESEVFPAADMLAARKIPFAFATAYGSNALPQRYRSHIVLSKPLNRDLIRKMLRTRLH